MPSSLQMDISAYLHAISPLSRRLRLHPVTIRSQCARGGEIVLLDAGEGLWNKDPTTIIF